MNSSTADAKDAFGVLASRLRLRILEALRDTDADRRYTFTELYEAVDGPNTSQFAYHLDRLTPRYVQQSNRGYVITDTGRRIVQSVTAGEYTIEPEFESVSVSTHCPECGDTTGETTYDGRLANVDCGSCGRNLLRYDLRPAHVADQDCRAALRAADRQMRAEFDTALDGVCQRCGGAIEETLQTGPNVDPATAIVSCVCSQCGATYSGPVEMALLSHPAVVGRYWAKGLDTLRTPLWELFEHLSAFDVAVVDDTTVLVELPTGDSFRIAAADGLEIQQRD
ncbi:DUF7351 domain-containing protein [Halobaculum rarum]|uniref:DUF7351 domain-containing protein n=1 Tax=Halobaculum rarum TaxID=3075122 RepID=UPI0032AFCB83